QQIKAYQERVGSVLYTAIMLRPDVAFAVSRLSHFLTNPSDQHMKAVERVIMYLYRTRWDAIRYGHYDGPDLVI
ncbi:Retrovirus-related Pol polyprotein from transposon TNT 1-94, partial [Pyrenophora tritici-repentis]